MNTRARTLATACALTAVMALSACGSDDGGNQASVEGITNGDGIEVDLGDGDGTLSIGGSDLPEGFPSEMPLFDESLPPIAGATFNDEDEGEQRVTVSFQPDATEDEVIEFYRRELPANGWTIIESDQQSWDQEEVPFSGVIVVEGHGYTGGVTILSAGGVLTLSFSLEQPLA